MGVCVCVCVYVCVCVCVCVLCVCVFIINFLYLFAFIDPLFEELGTLTDLKLLFSLKYFYCHLRINSNMHHSNNDNIHRYCIIILTIILYL